jgi:hypothetical protein
MSNCSQKSSASYGNHKSHKFLKALDDATEKSAVLFICTSLDAQNAAFG